MVVKAFGRRNVQGKKVKKIRNIWQQDYRILFSDSDEYRLFVTLLSFQTYTMHILCLYTSCIKCNFTHFETFMCLPSTKIIILQHNMSTFDNTVISSIESLTILFLSRGSLIFWQSSKSLYWTFILQSVYKKYTRYEHS